MLHPADEYTPDDAALMVSMAAGDQAGLSILYDRYASRLLGLAMRVTGEQADAEEVVVDAFAQAWRDAGRFDAARGSVPAWLATITRSRALDLLRSRARHGRLADAAGQESGQLPGMGSHFPSPVATVLADERSRALQSAMEELPASQRVAIHLAYFEGLSQSEIAERIGAPIGTVKTRIRLGMGKMRDLMVSLAPGGVA